jgi:secreted PhoX family phosphatase
MAKPRQPADGVAAPRSFTRRRLLTVGGAGLAAATIWPLSSLLGEASEASAPWRPGPFGAMRPDPRGILDLPEGFSYRVLQRAGDAMADGLVVPARCDGMACFVASDGALVLMRNHENPAVLRSLGPAPNGGAVPNAFDPGAYGGVSRVVLDPDTLEVRSSNLVLGGTLLNCAGGRSPWGWLSCEETVDAGHGYVFVCDPEATSAATPQPVRAYGRFRHEAATVDPATSVAYLTEDRDDACFYRFVPHDPTLPFEGELSALAVVGRDRFDTGADLETGESVEVRWVPVGDPDGENDDLRARGQRAGAAIIRRGEGLSLADENGRTAVYFSATAGGAASRGQIFRLDPEGDGGRLTSVAESRGQSDFDMPDNLVVSPDGPIYFSEDGSGRNYVRGIDRQGGVFDFARNALSRSEITGVSFAPDGRTMFLGLQVDGLTIAVSGPFERSIG